MGQRSAEHVETRVTPRGVFIKHVRHTAGLRAVSSWQV